LLVILHRIRKIARYSYQDISSIVCLVSISIDSNRTYKQIMIRTEIRIARRYQTLITSCIQFGNVSYISAYFNVAAIQSIY
jgi:hypothetical protein